MHSKAKDSVPGCASNLISSGGGEIRGGLTAHVLLSTWHFASNPSIVVVGGKVDLDIGVYFSAVCRITHTCCLFLFPFFSISFLLSSTSALCM